MLVKMRIEYDSLRFLALEKSRTNALYAANRVESMLSNRVRLSFVRAGHVNIQTFRRNNFKERLSNAISGNHDSSDA